MRMREILMSSPLYPRVNFPFLSLCGCGGGSLTQQLNYRRPTSLLGRFNCRRTKHVTHISTTGCGHDVTGHPHLERASRRLSLDALDTNYNSRHQHRTYCLSGDFSIFLFCCFSTAATRDEKPIWLQNFLRVSTKFVVGLCVCFI